MTELSRRAFGAGALALLLAGCAPIASSGTAAAPAGPADPEAIFRYANTIGVSRFDPHRASSSTDNTLLFLTYDRLVHTDAEGRAVPGLATAWEALDGGRTLQLDLRPGVTFHDGTPFDAAAVKANIERAKTVTGSAVRAELASIASVEVSGPLQVRLALSAPNAALPLILSDRAGSMVSPAAFDKPDLDQAPVGAGMYRVTSYAPGSRVEYRPAPGYWDPGAVRVAGIDMLIYTDAVTRLNAVRTGEVDATVLSPDQVPEAQSAGVTVTPGRTNNFYYLQPNRARPQFADVRVRRALWHAIDRKSLVAGLARGFGDLDAQPVPAWSFAHDPSIGNDPYPYDPARAKQLLAEAGYPDGFSFEVFASAGSDQGKHAEALQDYLAAVGIDMRIRIMDSAQIADVFFVREEGDGLPSVGGGRADPAQTTALRYTADGFNNPGGSAPPEFEKLQADVVGVSDEAARGTALHTMMRAVVDEALEVILYYPKPPIATGPAVLDYRPFLADRPEFRGMAKAAKGS
ncbi:MAG: ABC transporter substrate-binding protein [Pseudonocardia sp.]|nr:ABC transporter substrate-binding protein [Pseudonocardia sp.]